MRIFAVAVSPKTDGQRDLLRELARRTDGRYTVARKASTPELPFISLAGLDQIELVNTTTGQAGRAIRVFPDGSFDGFVPLAVGRNIVRVVARLEDGRQIERERTLFFARPAEAAQEDHADTRSLLRELQIRTLRTEMETRKHLNARTRRLEIQVEAP